MNPSPRYLILYYHLAPDGRDYVRRSVSGRAPPESCRGFVGDFIAYRWCIDLQASPLPAALPHVGYEFNPEHWAGQLPDQWVDPAGNLRGKDGKVIFKAS